MSAANKVMVIDDPVGQVGMQFASARHVYQQPKPKLRIALYPPCGDPEIYDDCTVLSGLMPELEFKGKKRTRGITDVNYTHIASTTLPYTITALTDVVH